MNTFDALAAKWDLRPLRNCPGRFLLRTHPGELSTRELLGPDVEIHTFNVASAKDGVLVARFAGGGLISYRRADGSHLHTLNTDEGFERKLLDLGVEV